MSEAGSRFLKCLAVLFAGAVIFFTPIANAEELSTRELQSFLAENGYRPGTLDGIDGPMTRAALKAFQADHGLTETGMQDSATQVAIGKEAEPDPSAIATAPAVSEEPAPLNQEETAPIYTLGSSQLESKEAFSAEDTSAMSPPLETSAPSSASQVAGEGRKGDSADTPPPSAATEAAGESGTSSSDDPLETATVIAIPALLIFLWFRRRRIKRKIAQADAKNYAVEGNFVSANRSASAYSAAPLGKQTVSPPSEVVPAGINCVGGVATSGSSSAKRKADDSHFRLANANPAAGLFASKSSPVSASFTVSDRRSAGGLHVETGSNRLTSKRETYDRGWFAKQGAWLPPGETVKIAGRTIAGMVYVGTPPRAGRYQEKCRAYIDPGLKASPGSGDIAGTSMPYWPSYSEMSPIARGTYLDWLASGRNDARYDAGYLFLYFYGLERRFFADKPGMPEKLEIVREVERLQALYYENHSARRYLGLFLEAAALFVEDARPLELPFGSESGELPLPVKILLGTTIAEEGRLSSEQLLSFWYCHPECYGRTPAQRCAEEFRALFGLKFNEKHPDGLKLRKPKRDLKVTYRAASSEFEVELLPKANGQPIPDISSLGTPVTAAKSIADEAIDELDKLSRYLGRNPEGRGSVEAHALLPPALWPLFPSADLEEIRRWAHGIIGGSGLVPLVDLIAKLEGSVPDKIGKKQLVSAADALARLGIGFSPDPRFALRGPKIGDPVMLFEQADGDLESVSDGYKQALTELTVGAFIAHADNEIAPAERMALQRLIDDKPLNEAERNRLTANLAWQLSVPPDARGLRKSLQNVSPAESGAIRRAIVAMVHADNVVAADEVSAIEKIYKFLGISEAEVYSDIHALSASDEPVTLLRAQPAEPGEVIPAEARPNFLDSGRIASIRQDTERVSSVLGAIFASDIDDDLDDLDDELHDDVQQHVLPGLDPVHAGFVIELVTRDQWSEVEFNTLASQHGLMVAGGLETINEWSFSRYDDALIEEYEGFELNTEIVRQLQLPA
ncbi:TerB N-terminal domain-containing protein [Stappia sp. ICDLI1TA098]